MFGAVLNGVETLEDLRQRLFYRQVARFLNEVDSTSEEARKAFVDELVRMNVLERFGETILLILEKSDDTIKPMIVGRIVAAHIRGDIPSYAQAMRLVAVVNRVIAEDLDYLRTFQAGVQADHDVAFSLASAGLLANQGLDGGDERPGTSGFVYSMNVYGLLLLQYGLSEPIRS